MKVLLAAVVLCLTFQFASGQSKESEPLFGKLILGECYPNPAISGGVTVVPYQAAGISGATLAVYDASGKLVETYALKPGKGNVNITASQAEGTYFYALLYSGRLVEKKEFEVVAH